MAFDRAWQEHAMECIKGAKEQRDRIVRRDGREKIGEDIWKQRGNDVYESFKISWKDTGREGVRQELRKGPLLRRIWKNME